MNEHAIRCHFSDREGRVCDAVIKGRTDEEAQRKFDEHVAAEQQKGNGHQ